MDYSNAISDYIRPPKAVRTVAWVLLALAIAGIVLGASIAGGGDNKSEAVKFNNSASSSGEYCYVDVVGVSDWLYKYESTTYYTILDKDGNYGIAVLKSSDLYAMSAQRTYWDSDDDTPAPEPYRIYGMSSKIGDSTKKAIAEVWGMSQVEYSTYFGKLYLNTSASPSGNKSSLFFVIGFMSLMGWIGTGLYSAITRSKARKAIGSLEASGRMEEAGAQFAGAMANYPSAPPALLTQDYLFMKNGGTVVNLSDIKWVFKRIQRYNFVKVGEYLIGKDSAGKERILLTINKNTEPGLEERILDNIRAKNPGLIEGYSREAQQAYSEYRKQVKNGMIPQ